MPLKNLQRLPDGNLHYSVDQLVVKNGRDYHLILVLPVRFFWPLNSSKSSTYYSITQRSQLVYLAVKTL